jgi:hypothetical protein
VDTIEPVRNLTRQDLMTRRPLCCLPLFALVLLNGAAAVAQERAPDVNALAKQTQNPLGDLVSVPLQFNFNTGGDLEDCTLFNLDLPPVRGDAHHGLQPAADEPGVQYYYNVERPEGGPGQQFLLVVDLLYPSARK